MLRVASVAFIALSLFEDNQYNVNTIAILLIALITFLTDFYIRLYAKPGGCFLVPMHLLVLGFIASRTSSLSLGRTESSSAQ